MSTDIRNSPSGKLVEVPHSPVTTDDVINDSDLPGETLTEVLDSLAGAAVYIMPEPNGDNDLPAFAELRTLAAESGGKIQFRSGVYRSPEGFNLFNLEGITMQGVGVTRDGLNCTLLVNTGPRTPDSAIVRFTACQNCYLKDLGLLAVFEGAEIGFLVSGDDDLGDSNQCHGYNLYAYGNAAGNRSTTSATSVNLSTAANNPTTITLASSARSYPVGTRLLVASRSGNGFMHGLITSLVGNDLTFVPTDVFGTATLSDWDVIQSFDGFMFASTESCSIDNSSTVLCYNSFRMNGVGGVVGPANYTSSPLGPQFRVDGSSSNCKLAGEAEYNVRYQWTVAVYVTGAVNLEVAVGMGDDHSKGTPFVFRSVRSGFIHNLNAQSNTAGAGQSIISMTSCNGVTIDNVVGEIVGGGAFIENVSGNGNCRVNGLFTQTPGMVTFLGGNFAGFDEWYDVSTNFLNNNFLSVQRLNARFGILTPPANLAFSNGANNNKSLSAGFQIITGPTLPFSISGFAPPEDGKRISFAYLGSQPLTLVHQAGSTAANQLKCPSGVDLVLTAPAGGFVYFDILYSSAAGKWLVIPMTYGP